jgi:hypothetical protein
MNRSINVGNKEINFAFLGATQIFPKDLDCQIQFTAVQQYYFWRSDNFLVLGGGSCSFLNVGPNIRYFNSVLPSSFICISRPVGNFGSIANPGVGNYIDGMGGRWGSNCGTVCSQGPITNEKKAVLITASYVGSMNGNTFDLYSDVNNYAIPFETGVSKTNILNGYISTLVPGAALNIKIKSTTGGCGIQPENNGVLITGII